MLAAVDLSVGSELLRHFLTEEVPPLQVARAQLALFILLIAGAHAGNTLLDFGTIAQRVDQLGFRNWSIGGGIFRIGHRRIGQSITKRHPASSLGSREASTMETGYGRSAKSTSSKRHAGRAGPVRRAGTVPFHLFSAHCVRGVRRR